jgi:hypothetical protein
MARPRWSIALCESVSDGYYASPRKTDSIYGRQTCLYRMSAPRISTKSCLCFAQDHVLEADPV